MNRIFLPTALILLIAFQGRAWSQVRPGGPDTQVETIKLTSPEQAIASFELPEGFHATLFAAEPSVRQPIALATDRKGRLWVAENDTYAEQPTGFDLSQRDRIIILEDGDGDNKAERRTVFWDGARRLTSVETGFGGVWALCPPQLLFLPDRDGDDRPDGAPEVVLDGFDGDSARHNIANGLRWGPDGWLYGRQGILAHSRVGTPKTPIDKRLAMNAGIWRYHPTRKVFEVVCSGTTNPWGMDWDEHGEAFFINTVIGHLWHAIPGASFQRMFGEDSRANLYGLIPQTADHVHWDTAETWDEIRTKGVTATTDQKGGGHAHSGLMIYLGENWPDRYRNTALTINLHGRRLNNDRLERAGTGYVGRHSADLLKTKDPWFRAVELIYGPDGGVYLADWSDIGECHEKDGVHRSSGRIYKITYGGSKRPATIDLATLGDAELVERLERGSEWEARQARALLQAHAARGRISDATHNALRSAYDRQDNPVKKLRVLWSLYVTGGTSEAWMLAQLDQPDEHLRAWAVRLLVDFGKPSDAALRTMVSKAQVEKSGLVLVYLASSLQKLVPADRWALAENLATHVEFASDPTLPLLIWSGIEPAVVDQPDRALALAGSGRMPLLTRFLARRLTAELDRSPGSVDGLSRLAAKATDGSRRLDLLSGMADALRGRRKAPSPFAWSEARLALEMSPDEAVRRLTRELSVVFGSARAVDDLMRVANAHDEPLNARQEALRVVVAARPVGLVPLLLGLLNESELAADAARGLAAFDDSRIPGALLASYPRMPTAAKAEVIVTLCARPTFARALVDAVASGTLDARQVPAFQVRQMLGFSDAELERRIASLWPGHRLISAQRKPQIAKLKLDLDPKNLAAADLPNGRRLFDRSCASCHTLFGVGGKIGPDLTGAQRSNLDYLLENIIDPSSTVGLEFRISTIALADGRVVNGIVGNRGGSTLTIQTPTDRLSIDRGDVEEIRASDLSLMPDGLLDPLTAEQVRDLIAYLMTGQQVAILKEKP